MNWAENGTVREVRATLGAWGRGEGGLGRNGSGGRQPNYEFTFLTPGASDASEVLSVIEIFC